MQEIKEGTTVGIIGAGTMGSGITQIASTAKYKVLLFDKNEKALENSKQKLAKIMNRLVEKGKYTQVEVDEIQNGIEYVTDLESFKDCKLVIEAIIEDLEIKQAVFKDLEEITSEDCVLATNTSSLSVASIGAVCNKPERVIGLHFFNPAPLMRLVEVVPALTTDPDLAESMKDLMKRWGKSPAIAKDTPGFIVNRVARPFYGEALRIYEEGIAGFATIDWAMKEIGGFRMGPFQLMDFIGNDVNYKVTETVFTQFYYDPRYKPSFTQKRLSEAGLLGKKSGKGYYDYGENAENPEPDKDKEIGTQIFERILAMLINEAADAVFWDVATKEDVDTAMTKGVNYPKGLLAWGDEFGIKKVVKILSELRERYQEDRYRISPLLREKAGADEKFFE